MEKQCSCENCEKRDQEDAENDEHSFAVLLALVPLLVMTLFGNIGLL